MKNVISLISGGFDRPTATYLMISRKIGLYDICSEKGDGCKFFQNTLKHTEKYHLLKKQKILIQY